MPSPKVSNKRPVTNRLPFEPSTFINKDLTAQEQRDLKKQPFGADEYDRMVDALLKQSYKLTTSWDGRNECYAAWIIPIGSGHMNYGFILSGRGSTPLKAVKQVCYKHVVWFNSQSWHGVEGLESVVFDD